MYNFIPRHSVFKAGSIGRTCCRCCSDPPHGKVARKGAQGTTDETRGLLSIYGNGRISDETAIQPVIVCFCDIPISSLKLHMGKYKIGIAFLKAVLIAMEPISRVLRRK